MRIRYCVNGVKMYLKALSNGIIDLDPGVEFLSVNNFPKIVSASYFTSMFSIQYTQFFEFDKHIHMPPVKSIDDLPIVVEPIEAKNMNDLPIAVEPIEAKI